MAPILYARKKLSFLILVLFSLTLTAAFPFFRSTQLQNWISGKPEQVTKEAVAQSLASLINSHQLPEQLELKNDEETLVAQIRYTLDPELQAYIQRELERYRSDYSAFVAIDARTGRILSLTSYQREPKDLGNLALRATFPAASVFKVVTAAAAIDQKKITSQTEIIFNGANHTLYKRNVIGSSVTRWTRTMSLREAFAKSVNTVFGKVGIVHVGSQTLRQYADRFMFNQSIRADFPALMGSITIEENDHWKLAEAASGFTRHTTLSPLHGALIAAAVANDGVMMEPALVDQLLGPKGETLYQSNPSIASVTMTTSSADDLRLLMRETVAKGTSQKSFRKVWRRKKMTEDLELGGKTGSLTGADPIGRYDWFVGYMRYKEQRIAVAALNINGPKWRVKSAFLASQYFAEVVRQQNRPGSLVINVGQDKVREVTSE